jgi:hypothetical protein
VVEQWLKWLNSGLTVVEQWFNSGSTAVEQWLNWLNSGLTMVKPWLNSG